MMYTCTYAVQQYTQYVHIQKKKPIVQLKDYNDYIFGSHL